MAGLVGYVIRLTMRGKIGRMFCLVGKAVGMMRTGKILRNMYLCGMHMNFMILKIFDRSLVFLILYLYLFFLEILNYVQYK